MLFISDELFLQVRIRLKHSSSDPYSPASQINRDVLFFRGK